MRSIALLLKMQMIFQKIISRQSNTFLAEKINPQVYKQASWE